MKHKNQIPIENKFWNVIAVEGEDQADILLYGVIGQYDWWNEGTEDDETITDLVIVRKIKELERKGYNRINIRINSPGGSVYHGQAIVTAILNSKAEVHTYVDGLAASMASGIWMAGHVRHISLNSMVMIHAAMGAEFGNAEDMRRMADMLDKYTETLIPIASKVTGQSNEEIKEKYYSDYQDHWLTAEDCVEEGFVSEIDGYEVEPIVSNPQNMNHKALMNKFQKTSMPQNIKPKKANTMNIFKFISNLFGKEVTNEEEAKEVLNAVAEQQKQFEETEFATIENLTPINDQIAVLQEKTEAIDGIKDTVSKLQETVENAVKANEEQAELIKAQKKTIENQATSIENLTNEIATLKGLPKGGDNNEPIVLPTNDGGDEGNKDEFTVNGDFIKDELAKRGQRMKLITGV